MSNTIKVVDIETTGVDTYKGGDMIVQLCYMKVNPDGAKQTKKMSVKPLITKEYSELVKPETILDIEGKQYKRVHPKAQEVHGISLENLIEENAIQLGAVAEKLASFLSEGYLLMYSGLFFDRLILEWQLSVELGRPVQLSKQIIDPYLVYLHYNPTPSTPEELVDLVPANFEGYLDSPEGIRSALLSHFIYKYNLSHTDMIGFSTMDAAIMALYRRESNNKLSTLYKKLFDKEMEGAHDAEADVEATYSIYLKLKEMYGFTDDEAVAISTAPEYARVDRMPGVEINNGVPCLAFGKHKGTPLADLPSDYVAWMEKKGFDPYLIKQILYRIKQKHGTTENN